MAGSNVGSVYLDLKLNMKELEKGFKLADGLAVGFEGRFGEMLDGMTGGWQGAWVDIERDFKGCLNRMIDGLNSMISGLNKVEGEMPPSMGGGRINFNIPKIANVPALAKGGIVSAPTLALVGEAGREAVLPLENNTGWMADMANMLVDTMGGAGGGPVAASPKTVVLQIDGKKLASVLIDDLEEIKERREG